MRIASIGLGLLLAATGAAASADTSPTRTLPPADECAADASFRTFRADLQGIIARKDPKRLLAIVSPDIKVDFGGGEGRAAFVKAWKLDRPSSSPIWAELSNILALGCAKYGEEMAAPYLFARFPENLDAFTSLVVVKSGTPLRAAPQAKAQVKARLSWDILTQIDEPKNLDSRWRHVRTADGRAGYVEADAVRSPVDYRAIFSKQNGRWVMALLIAGD